LIIDSKKKGLPVGTSNDILELGEE